MRAHRLEWRRSHLVTIKGYSAAVGVPAQDNYGLAIADPWWGLSDIDAAQFPRGYVNCGTWTDTYYTRRATA